jgi:hypothetical protein
MIYNDINDLILGKAYSNTMDKLLLLITKSMSINVDGNDIIIQSRVGKEVCVYFYSRLFYIHLNLSSKKWAIIHKYYDYEDPSWPGNKDGQLLCKYLNPHPYNKYLHLLFEKLVKHFKLVL